VPKDLVWRKLQKVVSLSRWTEEVGEMFDCRLEKRTSLGKSPTNRFTIDGTLQEQCLRRTRSADSATNIDYLVTYRFVQHQEESMLTAD